MPISGPKATAYLHRHVLAALMRPLVRGAAAQARFARRARPGSRVLWAPFRASPTSSAISALAGARPSSRKMTEEASARYLATDGPVRLNR